MGTLWPYYKVVFKGTECTEESTFLLRPTSELGSHILGYEVDEHGKTLCLEDGGPRFQTVDRAGIHQMTPLVLLGGRLVSAESKARAKALKLPAR